LLLSALLVFATLPATAAAASPDIAGHWAEDTLAKWSDLGWFTGDGDGTYRPNASITRAEFAALVNRMKGYSGESADIAKYKDVSADAWYCGAISTALATGYLTGVGADAMAPEKPITRQEAITIIARIEGGLTSADASILSAASDGGDVAAWARESVAASIEAGLVAGSDGKINPAANITRAESVVLMDRVYAGVRSYAFAGDYGPESGTLSATAINIAGDGVRLRNATVSGDLTIAAAVGGGDVYLDSVTVNGSLFVRGGGLSSIHLSNCTIKDLIVEKDSVRVVLGGGSSVSLARLEGGNDVIELEGATKIETLDLAGASAQVSAQAGSVITTLNVEANGAKIETQTGASIGTANINGSTEITGGGSIATANIKSDGVVIETKPAATNVADGLTATVGGSTVSGSTAGTSAAGGGGSSSSGGGGGESIWLAGLSNPFLGKWDFAAPEDEGGVTFEFDFKTDGTFDWRAPENPEYGTGTAGYIVFGNYMIIYMESEDEAGGEAYSFRVVDNNTISVTEGYFDAANGGRFVGVETLPFVRTAGSEVNRENKAFALDNPYLGIWRFEGDAVGPDGKEHHYLVEYKMNADGTYDVTQGEDGVNTTYRAYYFVYGDTLVVYVEGEGVSLATITAIDDNRIIVSDGEETGYLTRVETENRAAVYAVDVPGAGAVNYILVSLTESADNFTFNLDGKTVTPTKVLSDGTQVKIAVDTGKTSAALEVSDDDGVVLKNTLTFAAGQAAPDVLYGTVPMTFSEFFHDITAEELASDETVFCSGWENADVAVPEKFITQGTRTGALTYAEGDLLDKVDVISGATYGDSVHFLPEGNLILRGDRLTNTDPNSGATGIKKVEVGVSFDLYANATLLEKARRRTAQSANVAAKMANFEGAAKNTLYSVKYMLIDGNWGARAILNANAAKALPGAGNDGKAEAVEYGGNWGDKVTGFSFGDATALGEEYAGANYWDNFAEYLYGGYIEDSAGHREPLVFLQNLFSHRMHEDFDIAISPSRFSRLSALKSPDTYTAHIYVYGFEDVVVKFDVKNYINQSLAISGGTTSFTVETPNTPISFTVTGAEDAAAYAAGVKLFKGNTEITANSTFSASGDEVTVTLAPALFTGAYQGAHSLSYETVEAKSKTLSFTLVNPADITLGLASNGSGTQYTSGAAFEIAKTVGKLYFSNAYFASTLTTSGRSGFSTIKESGATGDAAAIGAAVARTVGGDAASPYCIDLAADVFAVGKTYELTMVAPGFKTHIFRITIK
jgi:hypothetical protein